jgi:hypothetical protein
MAEVLQRHEGGKIRDRTGRPPSWLMMWNAHGIIGIAGMPPKEAMRLCERLHEEIPTRSPTISMA